MGRETRNVTRIGDDAAARKDEKGVEVRDGVGWMLVVWCNGADVRKGKNLGDVSRGEWDTADHGVLEGVVVELLDGI